MSTIRRLARYATRTAAKTADPEATLDDIVAAGKAAAARLIWKLNRAEKNETKVELTSLEASTVLRILREWG